MATLITKNSSTAAAVPGTGALVQGELAVNVTDKRLFTKNSGGTVVEVGTNPSSLVVTGDVGIGTSSPAQRLDVSGAENSVQARFGKVAGRGLEISTSVIAGTNDAGSVLNAKGATSGTLIFQTDSTERMRLDATGNLGLGVTPSAQGIYRTMQFGNYTTIGQQTTGTAQSFFGWNVRGSSTANQYLYNVTADKAALYEIVSDASHRWSVTNTSGTAGNAITFTEAMRLDASANLLVGLASPTFVSTRTEILAATNNNALGAKTTQNNYAPLMAWNSATTGDNLFQYFYTEGTLTLRGSIDYNRAGGLVRYNTTSDYRAKDILGPVADPGATIDALKVYEGRMKGATQSRPMLVAHEAQEHAPYAVSGEKDEVNEDGSPKFQQIDVSSLVPLLLAEIQSLRARVAALEQI